MIIVTYQTAALRKPNTTPMFCVVKRTNGAKCETVLMQKTVFSYASATINKLLKRSNTNKNN